MIRPFLTYNLLLAAAALMLLQTGCGPGGGKSTAIKLASGVKLRLVYLEPLKIYVGRYEVSNGEFRSFRPSHNSGYYENDGLNDDKQPVVNVSWNDAHAFCEWLTRNSGSRFSFRLPREKEWEAFAACGKESEYPWGEWPPPKNPNYYGRENKGPTRKLETADGYRVACPVTRSGRNEWGLYGVAGNVWEWCEDGENAAHIIKGGSWSDCAQLFLRTACRRTYPADYKYVNLGFRVVAEPATAKSAPPKQAPSANKDQSDE